MTKFIASVLGMSALAATAAFADMSAIDTNGDGLVTMDEIQAAYPEVTAEQFSEIDTNGDGAVDDAEMSAAQDAGLLPATEG
ncbi:calcium-binding protein [Pelagivirga sediminicola]|uniref:Calcium-binding protein n=1 Tax=Pelagivirga sediminicola TaxID=2170575 RepID=A0A2T7GAN1_9RHOB|nr:EF-hand domain-containing protein [Pelagivirga sediminicola]PVA11456.1 calcium-binding protein [Pelagivirga sediminicola]